VAARDEIIAFIQAYQSSPLCSQFLESQLHFDGPALDLSSRTQRPSMVEHMSVIGVRNFKNMARNPMGMRAKFFQAIFMGGECFCAFVWSFCLGSYLDKAYLIPINCVCVCVCVFGHVVPSRLHGR
jgi:hypothetical protein